MSLLPFNILWCQGGIEDFAFAIIVFLVIVFRALNAIWGTRTDAVVTPLTPEEEQEMMDQLENEWEQLQKASVSPKSVAAEVEYQPVQSVFNRAQPPQEECVRFEVEPGTLNDSRLSASPMEPTVKPTLESLTGIYEDAFAQTEPTLESAGADIYRQLLDTANIRQAFILAEIFRRPDASYK